MARFQCNVISYVLGRTVDITVVVPTATIPESMSAMMGMDDVKATHVVSEKYPVLYLLHGMGNNHATWCGYSNIELFAEERNMAVVMISGENKCYRTADGSDDYFRFIQEELPEFVTNMFPVSDKPEHTYIAGLSMGGYGALLHGLSSPGKFAAIGSFSGAVHGIDPPEKAEERKNGPLDLEWLAERAVDSGKLPPIYLACGENDFLYEANQSFRDMLRAKNADVTWVSVPGYGHEWRFWNMQVEEFLKWIPRTDGYAARGIRQI